MPKSIVLIILFYLSVCGTVNGKRKAMGQDKSKEGASQTTASCQANKAKSAGVSCTSEKTVIVSIPSKKPATSVQKKKPSPPNIVSINAPKPNVKAPASVQPNAGTCAQKKKASPPNSVSSKVPPKVKAQSPVPVQPNAGTSAEKKKPLPANSICSNGLPKPKAQSPPPVQTNAGSSAQKKQPSPAKSISSNGLQKVNAQLLPQPVQPNSGKKLTPFLKHVEADLKLKDNVTKKNVETMECLLEELMKQMKGVDELFDLLYRNIFYTGSYYDGLRITSASEFDLNVVLTLPFKEADRDVQAEPNCPAYAKYRLKTRATHLMETMSKTPPPRLAKFFDDKKNYLLPEKIRSWLQSVLDKAMSQRKTEIDRFCQNNGLQITTKQSGPARTLLIRTRDGGEIDIDLVPVIQFRYPEWPNGAEKHVKLDYNNGIWFLVPKPYFKGSAPLEPKDEDVPRLWRLHFPMIERELLYDRGYVKPLIKFLKKLRDEENWKKLASYYLKTFVMWEILKSDAKKWNGELGELFLELLRTLSKKLKERNLQYLFYPKYNLLRAMNQAEADGISNRLERIISKIEKEPRNVLGYLGCKCPNVLDTL